jgi:hypothetical protein
LHYGNSYYIERIAALEKVMAKKPRQLQLDMIGEGEIPADWALLIRSILNHRTPKTQVITNARTSLQNGSVLVWLLGDCRIIRNDARLFFRRANIPGDDADADQEWKEGDLKYSSSHSGMDPDEVDYAKVLQLINEYLPVNELAGRTIEMPVLRQFGLVDNEKLDTFLATAFRQPCGRDDELSNEPRQNRVRARTKSSKNVQMQK